MVKRIRKHKGIRQFIDPQIKTIEIDSKFLKEISLTSSDKITYSYKRDKNRTIVEVTNVSYEIKIKENWITIVRYDSSHGYLHRHMLISILNQSDTPTTFGVRKKGTHDIWLTWAINDIKKRFEEYKKGFLKRSELKSIDIT